MRKLILITATFFLGLTQFVPSFIEKRQRQQILAATVMMTITVPNWQERAEPVAEALPIPPDEYRTIARAEGEVVTDGLGTLVVQGGERLLVTHDHWSRFDETLGTVTFRASDGAFLAEMELRDFRTYLLYRDGGTMVLAVPDVLATAVSGSAEILPANALAIEDGVLLAQRAGDRVMLTEASVIAQSEKQGVPVVRLQSQDGQVVVSGDSGGGVWVNGRLAATMWTTIMMESPLTGERQATDMSIAAVYAAIPFSPDFPGF
jgi:hypothetical protein